jgi:hypothetical protein
VFIAPATGLQLQRAEPEDLKGCTQISDDRQHELRFSLG